MEYTCDWEDKNGDVCEAPFDNWKALHLHHIKYHEARYKVICEEPVNGKPCNRTFWYPHNLQKHVDLMHSKKKCEECAGLEFDNAYEYQDHYEKVHQKTFHCKNRKYCSAQFPTKEQLEKHVCLPVTSRLKCTFVGQCEVVFKDRTIYNHHLQEGHGITHRQTRLAMVARENWNLPVGAKNSCGHVGVCGASFSAVKFYAAHLTRVHKLAKPAQKEPYLSNLTTKIVDAANLQPIATPPPAPSVTEEEIFFEPKAVSLDPNWTLDCMHRNTYTSGRIQVRHNPIRRAPDVVYQYLDREYIRHPQFIRTSQAFLIHPDIPRKEQLGPDDYTDSPIPFDKGHLAKKRLHIRHSSNFRATFYYPYTAPQYRPFNRQGGLWYKVEVVEQALIGRMDRVHSYSGPGYAPFQGVESFVLGNKTIASFFYKVLVGELIAEGSYEVECYACPHKNEKCDDPITDYFIDIHELNKLLDLDQSTPKKWRLELLKNLDWTKVKRYNHVNLM